MPRNKSRSLRLTRLLKLAVMSLGALAALTGSSFNKTWKSVAEVQSVMLNVHWVSTLELLAAARRLGQRPATAPLGFSVLQQTSPGQFVCDVYLVEQPRRVDDRATASAGHEMMHCVGYSHE